MSKIYTEHDAFTGVTTKFRHDAKEGINIIEHIQDVEPFIKASAEQARQLDKKQNWWYVGTIPDSVVLQWAQECQANPYSRKWRRYAQKQLNRREYRKFNPNNIKL